MHVLGLHIGAGFQQPSGSHLNHSFRTSAAALVSGATPTAWTTEDRAGGVSGAGFPHKAVEFCLGTAGVGLSDVDAIVVDVDEATLDYRIMQQRLHDPRRSVSTGRHWLASEFRRRFGADVAERLHFCDHSMAHVYAALRDELAGDALSVCFDGAGHSVSGVVAHIRDGDLRVLAQFGAEECLFNVYRVVNGLLGFDGSDIYETFALASSGNAATYWPLFQAMHQLLADGGYSLAGESEMLDTLHRAGLFAAARRNGGEFSQQHRDIAAAGQLVLRKIVGHVLKHYQQETGSRRLYLCGSIAENTELNGRILHAELFERVMVTPVPDDSGNALGAARWLLRDHGGGGVQYVVAEEACRPDALAQRIEAWKPLVAVTARGDAIPTAAALLARGVLVGWVQFGRGFQARSAGYRCLLADPRVAGNRLRIAAILGARPETLSCCASVLTERLADCFDVPAQDHEWPQEPSFNLRVRTAMQALLPGVMLPGGMAVTQGVGKTTMPEFHALITAFADATGVPALCCTDMRDAQRWGADCMDAAIAYLLTTDLDYLLIGDWLLEKRSPAHERSTLVDQLLPAVARGHRLVRGSSRDGGNDFSIESMQRVEFFDPVNAISTNVHRVLCLDQPIPVRERRARLCIDAAEQVSTLAEELLVLWRRGLIAMRPVAAA